MVEILILLSSSTIILVETVNLGELEWQNSIHQYWKP